MATGYNDYDATIVAVLGERHIEQQRRIVALERELAKLRGAREHNDTDVPVGTAMPHARSSTYKN